MKINEYFEYYKAYTNNVFWPWIIYQRRRDFEQMSIKTAQFSARGWVLDVGTGPAHLPLDIVQHCPDLQVIGLDISHVLLNDSYKRIKKKHLENRIFLVQASSEALPFSDSTFDVVQSMYSLHLWKDKQQGLKEIHRVLKPGGRVLILVGRRLMSQGFAKITDYFTHKSSKSLKEICSAAGYKEVTIRNRSGIYNIILTR